MLSRSVRRLATPAALLAVVLNVSAQAQQSNGLTFYHLVDATTKDNSGNLITNIKAGPQTDGTVVAFESGSATTACDSAASLYTVPITGGSVSTLAGPGIQVESSEPVGTATVLCSHLVLSGSTLFYPANYTPTGGTLRSGIFKLPIAGGTSTDALATGDMTPSENFQTPGGTRVTQPGTVSSVATTIFSADPSSNLIANYTANFTAGGPYSFNTVPVYGYPPLQGGPGVTATSTCPGVTVPVQGGSVSSGLTVGMESGYSENAPWYADIVSGSGTNYSGATVGMQFLRIAIWPYGGCESVVFGPDLGSLKGGQRSFFPESPSRTLPRRYRQ